VVDASANSQQIEAAYSDSVRYAEGKWTADWGERGHGYIRVGVKKGDIIAVKFDAPFAGIVDDGIRTFVYDSTSDIYSYEAESDSDWFYLYFRDENKSPYSCTITITRPVPVNELSGREGASLLTASAGAEDLTQGKLYACHVSYTDNSLEFVSNIVKYVKDIQQKPTTPAAVNETIKNKADGKIEGVSTDMEYKKQGDTSYTFVSDTSIEGLEAGTYLVRYKETETHNASEDTEHVIESGKTISVTFDMGGQGTGAAEQAGKAYGDKITAPTAPTDDDCKFIGWYKENTFINEWDFTNGTLADDTILYAKWQDKKSVAINEAVQTYYYNGAEKAFVVSGTDATLTGFDIQYKIDGTYGTVKPTDFGSYDVKITRTYDDEYKAYAKEIIGGLVIAQSGTAFADKQVLKDGTPETTFTYGDTITVKIKPQATGQAAAMTLMSLSAPEANQMALYYNGTQVSDAVSADDEGYYTMTLDTTSNSLPAGNVNLTAEYAGNDNMTGYAEQITLTLDKATSSVTAPVPIENLVYNKNEQTLINAATNVAGGTVQYKLDGGEYSIELPGATNAGTYTVYYKVFGDSYHDNTLEDSVSVTILPKKINPSITLAAPVPNETPVTSIETEEYIADITWSPAASDTFKYNTVYTATVTVTPKTNYTLEGIGENGYTVEGATVINEANAGDITAKFEKTGPRPGGGSTTSYYTVTFNTDGGSKVDGQTLKKNTTVTEPVKPTKEGYTFEGWYTDKGIVYDFNKSVASSFTLYAKWAEETETGTTGTTQDTDTHTCPSLVFEDLDVNAWYHPDVDYVLENGLMRGVADAAFAPDENLTRAMFVTVLYRLENEPATNRSIPFVDLNMGAYYANAVVWAQQNGIVKGVSETEFAPEENITREQIAAIIHRYAKGKRYDVSVGENTNILSYDDFDSISEYAIAAMQYAVGSGLLTGRTASKLNPKNHATRAEIAASLHRFIETNK